MKTLSTLLGAFLLASVLFLQACEDDCQETITYISYQPVFMLTEELRSAVAMEAPRNLETPGKIWIYGQMLLINEPLKGIHVFDNTDPENPQSRGFINIPGNVDMAVRGNLLYADSYIDLVMIDLSNPLEAKEVGRIQGAFPMGSYHNYGWIDPSKGVLVDWESKEITETRACGSRIWGGWLEDNMSGPMPTTGTGGGTGGGKPSMGGSMARFAIEGEYLYTVNDKSLRLFSLETPALPAPKGDVPIGFGIETIFPYGDHLFIGANNGMHIFSIQSPEAPEKISSYQHVQSCDPVVVQGKYAYVTLRSGNACQGFTNQLEVVDISNLAEPKLFKTYPMQNPHGLGINQQQRLYICEGTFGLKALNAKDPENIELLTHFTNLHAYDIIVFDEHLLVIGQDGLYQYREKGNTLEQISVIPVVKSN
jgi:hypothetical protein